MTPAGIPKVFIVGDGFGGIAKNVLRRRAAHRADGSRAP